MYLWCMDVARTTEKGKKRCRDGEFFATPSSLAFSLFFFFSSEHVCIHVARGTKEKLKA